MNKYSPEIYAVYDFHRLNRQEAELMLNDIIKKHRNQSVRIITGKGLNSQNGPVLKDFVKKWCFLNNLYFRVAKIKDGGDGAIEIVIPK